MIAEKVYTSSDLRSAPHATSPAINKFGALMDGKHLLPSNPSRKGEGGLRFHGRFKSGVNSTRHEEIKNHHPLITVITVVFNGAKSLKKAILSVLNQRHDNVEYIIIDGGSSDGTLDIVREYEQAIDYWISEPDSGIYAAMNKGITLATGDYICFINADDYFFGETVLSDLCTEIGKDTTVQSLYYGDVKYINGKIFISSMGAKLLIINTVHHQGAFYARSLFASFRYDESLKIGADYELNLIIHLKKLPSKKINGIVSICGDAGVSKTTPQTKTNLENHYVRQKYIGQIPSIMGFMLATLNMWRRLIWARRD